MKNDSVPREQNSADETIDQSADGRSTAADARRASRKNRPIQHPETVGEAASKNAADSPKNKSAKVTEKPEKTDKSPNNDASSKEEKPARQPAKKKKKRNTWPLWAMMLSFVISIAVNVGSELVLDGTTIFVAAILVVVILFINVVFDMISMAVTTCDIEPFLAMASRKVRGAKTAVKLAKKADVVSSFSGDIVGDICGVVSGVCSASIAGLVVALVQASDSFWVSVLVTAVISTLTITMKAIFKKVAVDNANQIIFGVAKFLAFFKKDI